MKQPIGYAQPKRLATPKKPTRLNLRRQSAPAPDDGVGLQPKSHFWRWVVIVALAHVVVICLVYWVYESTPAPKPPDTFIEMLPPGDKVKGTPGEQQAPKVGLSPMAPSVKHTTPAPKPTPVVPPKPVTPPPVAVQPPKPTPPPVEPVVKPDAPTLTQDTPVPVKPPTPKPPKVAPKVKVDLTLTDGPVTDKPVKPKPHPKKPAPAPAEASDVPAHETASDPNNSGLSKSQIAAALGQKVQAAGVTNATKIGASGSQHSTASPFDAFYLSVRDQVMNKWQHPNLATEPTVNPEVMIHVEKDGRVPPEKVYLAHSSGNTDYDNTALAAARSIGYTLQPLPDGCPPDMSIDFTLTP